VVKDHSAGCERRRPSGFEPGPRRALAPDRAQDGPAPAAPGDL